SGFTGNHNLQQGEMALPASIIDRPDAIAHVVSSLSVFGTSVICGPSGVGKSVLAQQVARRFDGPCTRIEASQFSPRPELGAYELILIDDLTLDHSLLCSNWISRFPGKLVVATRSLEVRDIVLSQRGLADHVSLTLELGGLDATQRLLL